MFHGVLAMLSPAFFLLSGSLYLLSSLTAPSVAVPAPAPVPAAEAIARASIWSDDNLRRSGGEDEDRRLRQKEQRHGQLGAVASESRLCSGIGTDMLTRGGNAADAVSITSFFLSSRPSFLFLFSLCIAFAGLRALHYPSWNCVKIGKNGR